MGKVGSHALLPLLFCAPVCIGLSTHFFESGEGGEERAVLDEVTYIIMLI